MTHKMRLLDPPELEPPLIELPRLRELSRLEQPSHTVRRFVYTRARHTLNKGAPSLRRTPRARAWALALAVVVVVPSALAATPVGALIVQRTVEWATRAWAFVDSATALRDANQARQASSKPNFDVSERSPSVAVTLSPPDIQTTTSAPSALAPKAAEQATPGGAVRSSVAVMPNAQPTGDVYPDAPTPELPPTLSAERRLLETARVRLRAGDTSGAMMLATRHAQQFPNGILTTERQAIINQAYQLQGQTQ